MAKPKGSTVIITFMYVTWVAYLVAMVAVYNIVGEWFPQEVTFATAALFIAETVSLARLKMAKEGTNIGKKKNNQMLEQIGIYNDSEFEEMAQKINKENYGEQDSCRYDEVDA